MATDWYLKLVLLATSAFFVGVLAMDNWEKAKGQIALFLIALFSQTGFAYEIRQGYHTSFAELVYFVLLSIMVLTRQSDNRFSPDIGINLPISMHVICSLMGIITALTYQVQLINIFIEIKSYVGYIFYLYLVPFLIKEKKDIKRCLWAFIVFSVIPLGYIIPNLDSLAAIETERIADFTRGWGALNIFVGYILPVMFIAITLIYLTSNLFARAVLLTFVGVTFFILFYSQTRTGWGSFLTSFIVFAALARKKKLVFVVVPLLSIIIALSSLAPNIEKIIRHRLFEQTIDQQDSSLQARLGRWETAIDTFKAHPILGSGWGGYLVRRPDGHMSDTSISALPRWHNSFFEILSQLGLLGVLTFYGIWIRLGKLAMQARCLIKDNKDNILLSGLIAAVLSCFIYSFGEQQFYKIETASVTWFVAGLLVSYVNIVMLTKQEQESAEEQTNSTKCV